MLARLLLTGAMIYLFAGFVMGPAGLEWIALVPMRHYNLLKGIAESAMLMSLFTDGLKVGGGACATTDQQVPQRIKAPPDAPPIALSALTNFIGDQVSQVTHVTQVTGVAIASAAMTDAGQEFNEQLGKLAEMAIGLLVGAMLPYAAPTITVWWFVPLLFLVIRPMYTNEQTGRSIRVCGR